MELLDILKSGDVQDLVISNNIKYALAEDPQYDGTFFRMNSGFTSLYKAPNADTHFIDTNTDVIRINTEVELLSVTPNIPVTPDNGSMNFICRLDNTTNQTAIAQIIFYKDGVELGVNTVNLDKNEIGKIVTLSVFVENTVNAGQVISVNAVADRNVDVRGDMVATKLDVTVAADNTAAQVKQLIENHDFSLVLNTTQNLHTTLTRAEIESVIQAAGRDLPTVNVSFRIRDNSNHVFAISYLKDYDEYIYERLTVAN